MRKRQQALKGALLTDGVQHLSPYPKPRDSFLGDVSVALNLGGVKTYFSPLVQVKKCRDCLISVMGLVLGRGRKNPGFIRRVRNLPQYVRLENTRSCIFVSFYCCHTLYRNSVFSLTNVEI